MSDSALESTEFEGDGDPFAGVDPADDPFGADGEGDFSADDDPLAGADGEPVKQVDREGNEIKPTEESEAEKVAREAAEALAAEEADDTADAQKAVAESGEAPLTPEEIAAAEQRATAALQRAAGGSTEDKADAELAAAEATTDGSPAAAQGAGVDPEPAKPAEKPAVKPAAKARSTAKAPSKRKGARSGYYLLVPDGEGSFKQLTWREDSQGNVVSTGGKETKVADCYTQKEALSLGYYVAQKNDKGEVKVVAVPTSRFQVRTVAPEQKPQHVPLKIS